MAIKMAKKDKKLELRIKPKAGATDLKAIIRREAEDQPSSVAHKSLADRNRWSSFVDDQIKMYENLPYTGKQIDPGSARMNLPYTGPQINPEDAMVHLPNSRMTKEEAEKIDKGRFGIMRKNMLDFGNRMRANSITADPLTDREGYIQQVNTRRDNSAYTGKDLRLMSTPQLKLNKAKLEAEDNRAAAEIAAKRKAWENRTAEEKAADNAREQEAAERQARLATLTMEGLPIGYNMYGRPYTLTGAASQSLNKIRKRPEDYDESTALDYDRALYDFIYGEGAYDERYERDFDNLDREVSELWDKLENGTIGEDYDQAAENWIKTQKENAGDFGTVKNAGEIEKVQKEIDKRARVQEMEKNAPQVSGEYDPSRVSTTWAWVGGDLKEIVQGGEADELYWKINHPGEDLTMGIAEKDQTDPQKRIAMHPSDFMDDEQRLKFNQYFLSGDKEGALAYYKGLESTYLMPMYNQAQEQVITKMSQNEYAPLMVTERILTQIPAGISGTIGAGLALLGNEEAKNPDSGYYRQGKINTQIQETRGKVWGKQFADWFGGGDYGMAARIGTMLNGVVYSIADNLTAAATGTALGGALTGNAAGKFAQGAVQFIMSSEATANTMREKLEDGMDPTKAAVYGFGDGVIEWFTEKYSVEQLLNPNVKEMLGNKKEFIRYMMKNFTAEGSEEVASDVLGLVFDEAVSAITGTDSEMAARYKELTKNHQRTDAQAKGIIAREFGEKVLQSFVAGGLSGLLMSGARGEKYRIQERFSNRSLGADIRSEGNTNTEGKTGEQQLIEVARGMKDPEAQQAGNALAEKAAEGKKISDAEVGRLARTVYGATAEQYKKTVAETVERRVAEQLKDKGVTEDAGQMAEIISKNLMEGSQPTKAEVKVLAKSEGAIALWQSYNTDAALAKGLAAEVRTETEGQRSIMDKIGDLASKRRPGTSAVAADVDKAIAAAKGDTKAAIGALRESRSDLVSEEFAEKMQGILEKDVRAKESKNFIDDAMKVRLAAMTLAENAPKVSMSEESAQELFQEARAEFDNKDAQRIIRQTAAEPGKGTATFDGAEYGTREWTEKTAGIQEGLRRQMRALGEITTRAGLRVNFINDAGRSDINGYEMQDGSITINVASGMEHNMLTTMSHEMTHWLEQNSKEGYDALRSYILRTLRGKGQSVEEMAVRIIDNQNAVLGNLDGEDAQGLDLNGAMAEIVAQSCENLLSSQEMISELAQENPGLVQNIRNFVRRFTARIRQALKSMEGERGYDESISRQARALKDETEQIAKLWTAARREALGRSGSEGAEALERTAYSVEQRTEEDTQDAQLEGLDVPEMLRYSMVGAKARGGYAEQIARAKEMAAQGANATEIFRETGALQGFRGNWWVSIDNQNIQLKDGYEKRGGVFSLREALEAPELLKAYPQLGSIQVKPAKLENAYGAYNREQNVIRLDRNMMRNEPEKLNVVLRHEIQHAIQGIEGTYGGANLQSWRDVIDKLHMRRASEVDLYDRTVGEIEANAASRGGRDSRRMPTRAQYANAVAIEDYMDEDGNVREPAAEGKEKEIRFSLKEPVEEREDGLIAVHNLRESEMLSTIREGGLTAPSIAVVKAAQGHNKYGSVSVVFYPSAIDPRRSAKNKVYGADAYTPTRYDARVEQEIVSSEVEKAGKELRKLLKGENEEFEHELSNWLNDKLYGDETDQTLSDIARTGYNNTGLLAAYQKSKGNDIEAKMTEVVTSNAKPENEEAYNSLIDGLHERKLLMSFQGDVKNLSLNEMIQKYGEAFKEILSQRHERFKKLDLSTELGKRSIVSWIKQMDDYLNKGITKEARFDRYGTKEALQARTNEEDFINWLSMKLSNVLGQKGIRNNKDRFTDMGNRRSFKALHDEYTADNVVRAMYKNASRKGVHADYFKGLMATASKEYRSLAEIKKDAGRLGIISEEEYERYIEEKDREMDAICREIVGENDRPLNDARQTFVAAGARYAANPTIGAIKSAFKADGYTLTDETAEKVKSLMDDAREFATGYFEAKPERLMGFDEIAKVVLPESADQKLIDALVENGIDYETYDGTDEDRLAKLNSVENVRFSVKSLDEYAEGDDRVDVKQGENPIDLVNNEGNDVLTILPGNTVAATRYSLASYYDLGEREKMVKALKKAGYTQKEIDTWLKSLDNVANIIASDRARYDFVADRSKKFLKENGDVYKKTLDASTMCKKTRLYNGTFNLVQHLMPHTILMPEDLIDLFNIMKDMKLETPCGFCYVQSRRRQLGPYTEEWLAKYKGDYVPTVDEVTTSDGLEKLKETHPQTYKDFVSAMNKKGVNNPKLVQQRTDYRGEIRGLKKDTIKYLNDIGGLRIQSFSDFEVVHMLDMMQAVMDMKAVGLASQAYTKVPEFAWIFGNTGIKINLSLVGKGTGLDAKGNLVFDNDEGINYDEAMRLRKAYSKNVGTILVGINDDHIIAAMGDDRIDFIIPFHKSGWSANELAHMRGLEHYSDYTDTQNEYDIKGIDEDGNLITVKADSNIDPLSYWDFNKDGEYNARKYLKLCAENHIVPKFSQFLVDNGDGTYSLPEGTDKRSTNIRQGYWKTLIDFKMYDNEGVGAPQVKVEPNFNMEEAMKILQEYDGSHRELPESWEAAQEYVRRYKEAHPLDKVRTRYSVRDMMDLDVKNWMLSMNENSLRTEAEKEILRNFKGLEIGIQLKNKEISELKAKIAYMETNGKDPDTKKMVQRLKVKLESTIWSKEQKEAKMARIVSSDGYGAMMKNAQLFFDNFQYGLTSAEAQEATLALQKAAEKINDEIRINREAAEELAKKDTVKALRKILGETTAEQAANDLRREFHSTWTRGEIQNFLEPIMLKMAKGEDFTQEVEDLAGILIESDSRNRYEGLEALRGLEIVIGHGMMQELKATDSSIKEMRARLAGTGIKIRAARKIGNTWEASTLEQDISDLREEYPGMPDFGGEKDALENFVSWVEGMKKASMGEENYDERLAETMAQVMQKAAAAAQGIYIPTEARAQKQVLALIDFVKSLRAETKQAVETLNRVQEQAVEIWKQSGKAAGMTSILTTGIADALEYYNKMAKIAVDEAKRDKNNRIIEQMKSEAAQKLYKSNEEWRALIERDKEARGEIEKNGKTRNQIDTVIRRLYKLLKEPKGLKNVPEYMQGLAREVIGTLVESEAAGGRKITRVARKDILEMQRVLKAWEARDGRFNMADLNDAEEAVMSVINSDLMTLYDTLTKWNGEIKGKNRLDTVKKRGEILREMQEAINEIYTAIRREGTIQVNRREIAVEDQAYKVQQKTGGKKYREWTGKAGGAIRAMHSAIVSGNMTPEYFFRSIGNEGLSELWDNYHDAENRNGLELKKAQERIAAIAEEHGYKNWNTDEKITLELEDGKRTVTLGQLMSLYATWKREATLGPEMSRHLTDGGFYAEEDTREGFIGRQEMHKRPTKIKEEEFPSQIAGQLTEEQKKFVDDMVEFMSTDLSKLGNEASMAAYGIKMYKESYYFPFQMWDGIKSRKSNEGAGAAAANDQVFHPSFSKTRVHGANNAIVIGDFVQTVADHSTGMINYATMGLANEMMQKVLNAKLEGQSRNTRAALEEAYGREAMSYLAELQKQLNGGAVRASRSLGDKAITLFRKNAVAGSLSVAFQQPLSYIRAAMVINPKYMAQALMKDYWKGAYSEMTAHSGVAVIKDVGKFDMNAGQSAREYLMPEGYETKAQRAWEKTTEYATILPELMDKWTWTRMWVAVKAEQHAAHPEMDVKSDEFLDMCGERFNEVMRRTQVYDSTLVRSENMRNDHFWVKSITSFMAEPTLTLNVLADSVRAAVKGEKGGKALVAKAAAVFLTSAVMQAAIKAIFSTGRAPDEKKTKAENFMARFVSNVINEADPVQLIPGYNDLITLMKNGELQDDAMGAIGKIWTSRKGIMNIITGQSKVGAWRDIEDSVGQLTQLFSGLPAKNIMRELRAMYNLLINPDAYANRETSGAVIKYQTLEALANADNLAGVLIQEMGEAGYPTKNTDYYKRIYEAKKRGDEKAAAELTEFLVAGKGVKEKSIESGIKSAAKADESASAAETAKFLVDEGTSATDYIKDQLAAEELTAEEARKLLKEAEPEKDADSIWWTVDRIEYKKETGKDAGSGSYYRLQDAMEANKADEIRRQVKTLTDHGKKKEDIKKTITSMFKAKYLEAGSSGKIKIRDAIQKAYKALGYTAADADKIIDGWTKKK